MKNKKTIVFILLLVVAGLVIGGTLAYYSSNDTFTNEFNTGTYEVQASEIFESPDNWTPGTTTPKTVKVTNKGSTPIAVHVTLIETWEDANGTGLEIYDNNNVESVTLNYSNNYDSYWVPITTNHMTNSGKTRASSFYYNVALKEGESTQNLLDSVTFNPNFDISKTVVQSEDPVTHEISYTTTYSGYSGGKYTLQINVETVQYDYYPNIWNTYTYRIYDPDTDFTGMLAGFENQYYLFGHELNRGRVESITTLNHMNVPSEAIASWDASHKKDNSVKAWILDADNDNLYELYLGATGGVKANTFSHNLFIGFALLEKFDMTYLDTSNVISMYWMFSNEGMSAATPLQYIGIEDLDTSKVVDMQYLFVASGGAGRTYDFSKWDISRVTNMRGVFDSTQFTHTGTDNWPLT